MPSPELLVRLPDPFNAEPTLDRLRDELAVRAWDAAGQTQPERMEDVWNWKGYLDSAWHRVPVRVDG